MTCLTYLCHDSSRVTHMSKEHMLAIWLASLNICVCVCICEQRVCLCAHLVESSFVGLWLCCELFTMNEISEREIERKISEVKQFSESS